MNEEGNRNLGSGEANQDEEMNVECEPLNIDDPSNWKNIDPNLRDLLVERGPVRRDCDVNFPKDANARHFSSIHCIQHLANGEKVDRKWLIYSEVLDRVFCFCCKFFKQEGNKTQLATEGFKDWKNIGERLKGHESSNEHSTCMSKWIELEKRLGKNQTIDKSAQDQVSKEREHWRQQKTFFGVVQRIYVLFASSVQRWAALKDNVEGFTIKQLSQTRWESRIESVKPLRYHAPQITNALVIMANSTTEAMAKSEAKSPVTHELENFEFLFCIAV
ncbi:hypothetical protein RHMOL_Rhmol01G0096300 [Rhododendron molle]|uniref:Uncharacterized protein n=1 Tax=Rhododendron molle TaxID=49168 RepID=A0ACC0Q0A5_RHOML|nr:hypothetical protein RHMOL_Rhmol01G0096300 [Rhododendron molle]